MEEEKAAKEICRHIQEKDFEAVFAGGCVRDKLLGQKPHDFDIATSATPDEIKEIFPQAKEVGKAFGVMLVRFNGFEFEIATFRQDSKLSDGRRPNNIKFASMGEDASRRDFTINAMFYDPIAEKTHDFFGGAKDLRNKRIKFVGTPEIRIKEDYLRMLRAVRFASQFNFDLAGEDMLAIREHAFLTEEIAPERIREEFSKAFSSGASARFIGLLWASGLLYHILPEVSRMQTTEQDPMHHPEGDVLTHTVKVLKLMPDANVNLAWAALLHDVGKPDTTIEEENGRITSKEHEKVGAEIAEKILDRLKFSNEDKEHILFLVRNHMKPMVADRMKLSKVKKLVAEPYSEDLMLLAICDANSTGKEDVDLKGITRMKDVANSPAEIAKPEPLLTGKDLIEMGFKPGPVFKEILDHVYSEQLEENIETKEEAKEVVKEKWMKQ